MNKLNEKMVNGKAQETTLDADGVLSVNGRICVPRVNDLDSKIIGRISWFTIFYSSECDQDV